MSERLRGSIEMSLSMGISGTIGWVVVSSGLPILDLVFWRCAFGAAALLVVCGALGILNNLPAPRVFVLAALGGLTLIGNWFLLFAAFPKASVAMATAVYSTQPFMLLVFGALFLGERVTVAKLIWLGLAFAGLVLIVSERPDADYVGSDYFGGILLALGAAFLYALTAMFAKKLKGTPPHLVALIQVAVGAAVLSPFVDFDGSPTDLPAWSALVMLGVIYTGLVFTLQYGAIQRLPTHLIAALYFIYPAIAVTVDVMELGNRLHAIQVIGIATILLAAAGMNTAWPVSATKSRARP